MNAKSPDIREQVLTVKHPKWGVVGLGLMVWRAWHVMIERAPQKPSRNPTHPKRRK